jgi:hypothetical protein
MKRVTRDNYELSTGRRFYANCGIVGLSPDDSKKLEFHEGYDGGESVDDWTPGERMELARFMIDLWREWGNV